MVPANFGYMLFSRSKQSTHQFEDVICTPEFDNAHDGQCTVHVSEVFRKPLPHLFPWGLVEALGNVEKKLKCLLSVLTA